MKLVFIDPKCPRPYDPDVLASQGLGGTEATVVRVASALSQAHEVVVLQHNRQEVWQDSRQLQFRPMADLNAQVDGAHHLVFIQKAQGLAKLKRRTGTKWWLWLHNFVQDEVPMFWQDHLRFPLGVICVSRTHALHTARYMRSRRHSWLTAQWAMRSGLCYHHNPLSPHLTTSSDTVVNPFKLIFFSSPHKGLDQALAEFRRLHDVDSRFKLHVADPGYLKAGDARALEQPGIVRLGSLPQAAVLRHVAESLCVFYPQTKRPETFGLVYAEANAVGTPVLAHDFGSSREVLVEQNPPIDVRVPGIVQRTVLDWQAGNRPQVKADPRFSLSSIARNWEDFFLDPKRFAQRQELTS